MKAIFQLQHHANCKLKVVGVEQLYNTYDGIFTYDNSVTINVIQSVDLDEHKKLYDYKENDHTTGDCSTFKINEDGLYLITHLILPKKESLGNIEKLAENNFIYAYDNGSIVRYISEKKIWESINIEQLLELNITEYHTIAYCQDYAFSICKLKECFYNLIKNLLGKFCGADKCQTDKHKDLVYKRDILWMAINVIDYLLDEERYYEALQMLINITDCTGFCHSGDNNGSSGCGCRA